jgi:hypothetical protein
MRTTTRLRAAVLGCGLTACFPTQSTDTTAPEPAPAPAPAEAPPPAPGVPTDTRVNVDDPQQYYEQKIVAMVRDHHVTNGNFTMSVVPMPQELAIAGEYPKWAEKRWTDAQMLEQIEREKAAYAGNVHAVLTVVFVGDLYSTGRTQFQIPDDIAEYIFLENDRGQAVRCSRAVLPLMRMPGPFTEQVNVQLEFAGVTREHPDFLDTKSLRFVVGGLEFEQNAVVYRSPLSDLFADAPEVLRALYRSSGLWG